MNAARRNLPIHHAINDRFLLAAAPAQINPGGFQAFVAQQIGKQGNIAAPLNEAFGETMAEGMGMHHLFA